MIGLYPLHTLPDVEQRLAEHEKEGSEVHWLGAGSEALALAGLDREQGLSAAMEPVLSLGRYGHPHSAGVAGVSLIFAPPFDLDYLRSSGKLDTARDIHTEAARAALQNLESWVAATGADGQPKRPCGLVYALCRASHAFTLDTLLLGWAIGPRAEWNLLDGWSLVTELGAIEDIYSQELTRRFRLAGLKLVWTGPSHARVAPIPWPERTAQRIAGYAGIRGPLSDPARGSGGAP